MAPSVRVRRRRGRRSVLDDRESRAGLVEFPEGGSAHGDAVKGQGAALSLAELTRVGLRALSQRSGLVPLKRRARSPHRQFSARLMDCHGGLTTLA